MQAVYTKLNVSHNTWKKINMERFVNETMDEVISRVFDERDRYKRQIMAAGGSTL